MSTYISFCTKGIQICPQDSFFYIQLPQRVSFEKKKEVALVEVSYSNSLCCLNSVQDATFVITYFDNIGNSKIEEIRLLKSDFINAFELVETINEYIHEYTQNINLEYHAVDNVVKVEAKNSSIRFSKQIQNIFGISYAIVHNETAYSKRRVDLFEKNNFLNVITDIIEPQMNCTNWKPVLRRFMHQESNSKFLLKTFSPIYFPVAKNDFDQIRVKIEGDDSNIIYFGDNYIHLLLHFRDRI